MRSQRPPKNFSFEQVHYIRTCGKHYRAIAGDRACFGTCTQSDLRPNKADRVPIMNPIPSEFGQLE